MNDEWMQRLINHFVGIGGSREFNYALNFKSDLLMADTFVMFGYYCYAGIPDDSIAKKMGISIKKVETLRNIFYDFTYFPKDRITQWALLRQLKTAHIITDEQQAMFKRIYDCGEFGLKFQLDYHSLTPEEKIQADTFLSNTMVTNTLDLGLSVRTRRDASEYSRAVNDLAQLTLDRESLRQKGIQTQLIEKRLEKEDKGTDVNKIDEDQKLMMYLRDLSLNDMPTDKLPYVSITELK